MNEFDYIDKYFRPLTNKFAFNLKNDLPSWGQISGMLFGVIWFLDGFVHILFGTLENPEGCGLTSCVNGGYIGDIQVAEMYDQFIFPISLINVIYY